MVCRYSYRQFTHFFNIYFQDKKIVLLPDLHNSKELSLHYTRILCLIVLILTNQKIYTFFFFLPFACDYYLFSSTPDFAFRFRNGISLNERHCFFPLFVGKFRLRVFRRRLPGPTNYAPLVINLKCALLNCVHQRRTKPICNDCGHSCYCWRIYIYIRNSRLKFRMRTELTKYSGRNAQHLV